MSMFPTAGSSIYRNEEGEVLGWSDETSYEPEYCDICGANHSMMVDCFEGYEEADDDEEEEPYLLEAECGRCGETFNPDNDQDLMHEVDSKGVYCGGHGELKGEYFRWVQNPLLWIGDNS
jgi:hypothetical protein